MLSIGHFEEGLAYSYELTTFNVLLQYCAFDRRSDMALLKLILQLTNLNVGCCHLFIQCIGIGVQRRNLRIELFLQYSHLTGGIVEHLAGGGTVADQLPVALLFLSSLDQLLASGCYLFLHIGLLTPIDSLCGSCLPYFQPNLGGVDESHFLAQSKLIALIYIKHRQRTGLLGCHRHHRCLKCTCSIILLFFVSAGNCHQGCN